MEKTESQQYFSKRRAPTQVALALQALLLIFWGALRLNAHINYLALYITSSYFLIIFFDWVVLYAALSLVALPSRIKLFRLDRRHGLTTQTFSSWLLASLKVRAIVFFIGAVGIEWFYLTIRVSPERWWLLFWPIAVLYDVVLVLLLPTVLVPWFHNVSDLGPGPLTDRLAALLHRAGIPQRKLAVIHLKDTTRRVTAMVAGLGPTRRILLTDTMVANYTEDEIEAVIAHEAGHEICHHVPKRIVTLAVIYFMILIIAQLALTAVDNPADPDQMPLIVLGLWFGWLYAMIVFAIFARRQENAADRAGWALIKDVGAYISAMKKLGADNLIPGGYSGIGSYHPSLDKRIAAAEKFLAEKALLSGSV